MFRIGTKVMVASNNDNENYDDFRGKVLIITGISTSTKDHPGYDEGMKGMPLYDLKTEDGEEINCCLYEYELEKA